MPAGHGAGAAATDWQYDPAGQVTQMLLPRRYVPAAQASRLPDAVGVALMLRLAVDVTVPVAVPVPVMVPEAVRLGEGEMEAVDVALCKARGTQGR